MNAIWQGLSLSVLGISLTFAALGLLILAMFLLERIFRTRRLIPEERSPEEMPVASSLARDMREEETVVAIAVALAHLRSLDMGRSGLGEALEAGRGPWGMKHITRGSR
jgi:sodium pump decarboxylase gamma subunit